MNDDYKTGDNNQFLKQVIIINSIIRFGDFK